jgi:prepilin-type N-terminal cleavage/methylation domain-containing protein
MPMNKSSRGFTLIEVLVSLAILGLCSAVLFKVFSDNLDRTRRARNEAVAASLAQSLLVQGAVSRSVSSSGRTADGMSWSLQTSPFGGTGMSKEWPVDAVTVTATVSWRDGGTTVSRSLSTMHVVPRAISE